MGCFKTLRLNPVIHEIYAVVLYVLTDFMVDEPFVAPGAVSLGFCIAAASRAGGLVVLFAKASRASSFIPPLLDREMSLRGILEGGNLGFLEVVEYPDDGPIVCINF